MLTSPNPKQECLEAAIAQIDREIEQEALAESEVEAEGEARLATAVAGVTA